MTDMRAVSTKAAEFDNDLIKINRELKRLASVKHRLKKHPYSPTFTADLTKVLQDIELVNMAKALIAGPRKTVTTLTQEEVDDMNLADIDKALNCIRSKKTHTKYLSTDPGDNEEFRDACRIEEMLLEKKVELSAEQKNSVSKRKLNAALETLSISRDMTAEECLARLKQMMEV